MQVMNTLKTLILLSVVTLALGVLNAVLSLCGGSRVKITEIKTLLDPAEAFDTLKISSHDGTVSLVKSDGLWRMVEPYYASADEQAVVKALDALSQTPVEHSITDSELLRLGHSRADYNLEPPLLTVKSSGSKAVFFGSRTPDANGVYASIEGVDSVFVVPTNIWAAVNLKAADFRRKSLFRIDQSFVGAFDIKRASGSILSFSRVDGSWRISGSQAASSRVEGFLSSLTGALAESFVWPIGVTNESQDISTSSLAAWGLDPESAVTVTMKCLDGLDRQISFGKMADEKRVYALAQGSKAVVTVNSSLKDDALRDISYYVDQRLFPVEPSSVMSFSLAEGDLDIVLARTGDLGWRLDSPISAAADVKVVSDILLRILSLSSADKRESGLKVSISADYPTVFVESERVLAGRSFSSLRSKEILRIDPALVKRIVVSDSSSRENSAVVYDRVKRVWNVESAGSREGVTADDDAIKDLLSAVDPLKAERIVALKISSSDQKKFGLEKPFLTVAIDQEREDSFRRNILIGEKTKSGRFATVGASDAVFVISDKTLKCFLKPLLRGAK